MKTCPNPDCPHRRRVRTPAEFLDEIARCSDCGTLLELAHDGDDEGTEPSRAARPSLPPGPWRRLGVTLLAPLVLIVGSRVPLPRVDLAAVAELTNRVRTVDFGASGQRLSVLTLGIQPVLTAYLVVELAAVLVPAWRPLRHGGFAGRAKLERATAVLALLVAAFQGFGVVQLLATGGLVVRPGLEATLVMLSSMLAGVSCLVLAARWIGRHGLVNGFAALVVSGLLMEALRGFASHALPSSGTALGPLDLATVVLGVGAIAGATLSAGGIRWSRRLRRGHESALEDERRSANASAADTGIDYRTSARDRGSDAAAERRSTALPLPASGVAPLESASSLLLFPATLASMGFSTDEIAATLSRNDAVFLTAYGALVAGFAVVFAMLFNAPARIAAIRARLDAQSDVPALERVARADLRSAVLRTLAFFAVVCVLADGIAARVGWFPSRLAIVLATATAADLVAEWRARSKPDELVAVWPEHRPYALGPALEALRAAAIPAHARGAHLRAALQLAGPWVPIELFVPAPRAKQARRILARLLDATAPSRADAVDRPRARKRARRDAASPSTR